MFVLAIVFVLMTACAVSVFAQASTAPPVEFKDDNAQKPGVTAVVHLGPRGELPDKKLDPSILKEDDRYGEAYTIKIRFPKALKDLDLEACLNSEFYEPHDMSLKERAKAVTTIGGSVEHKNVSCQWMATSTGWRTIKRKAGAVTVYDNKGRPLFDEACKNPAPIVIEIVPYEAPPPPPAPVSEPAPPAPIAPEPIPVPPPPPPPPPVPEQMHRYQLPPPPPAAGKTEARFGVTGGVTPHFATNPVNGLVSGAAGKDAVCITGYGFDAGVAFGNPDGSFMRAGFGYKAVADGSSTRTACPSCNAQEVLAAGSLGAVRQYAFYGEGVWRMPIGQNWPVQPMIELHGGVGTWSGQVLATLYKTGGGTTSSAVPASKLLGTSAYGGGGVGLVGGNKKWTVAVTLAGIEIPTGMYGARVSLTRWF